MDAPDSLARQRAILEYWTAVEFFSPYLLENVLNARQHYPRVYADDSGFEPLPWQDKSPIDKGSSASPFAKGYHLYFALFNLEETADRARHVFANAPSQWQSVNWRQCASPGSTTCFARLSVTIFGTPLLGTLSLSTLPWAHGRLLNGEKQSLKLELFWKDVLRLVTHLREVFLDELPVRLVKEPGESASYFDHKTLKGLASLFFGWAGFAPRNYPLVLIEPVSSDETVSAIQPSVESERDLPILNSFYIQELEAAASSLESDSGKALRLYLGSKPGKRVCLESREGSNAILEALRPARLPAGRWPTHPSSLQSLMQQFAINEACTSTEADALLSVNGPPGTGKTTLLRELVAEQLVKRAKALSSFRTAQAAITGRRALSFGDGEPIFVGELHPSLLGYEMLLVSSNNTAVQNLTHELPLRSQIDPAFAQSSYLESVATKALGCEGGRAWGLIAAALGNRDNCRRFAANVFMAPSESEDSLRIWDWIDTYQGPSFSQARRHFLDCCKQQEAVALQLEELAFLHAEIQQHSAETYCANALEALACAEHQVLEQEGRLEQLKREEAEAEDCLALLKEREVVWETGRPRLLARVADPKAWEVWQQRASEYRERRIEALEELHELKSSKRALSKELTALNKDLREKEEALLDRALGFHVYWKAYRERKALHPTARLPQGTSELRDEEVQKQSYYQTEALSQARSDLFVAAMALHEAWLAETLRTKGGFRGNLLAISNVLQGKAPSTADDTRLAWQSVFLLIPLLSSTFASVGRLFRYLEPGSLGWVFIDEAGQGLPQAAVGAIWRARRVLSIGDPFQIEPITMVPPEIVDGMAKSCLEDHCLRWSPSQISVQHLMDAASRFGTQRHMRDETYWLGAPLRVHRRCLEPMFSIANEIAYEDSMILATVDREVSLSPSCWYDVKGSVGDRQYVPEQGEGLLRRLRELLVSMTRPDIYVISPFREVVRQLKYLLLHDERIQDLFENKFEQFPLASWVREAVGTVHSFQGKQSAVVFFVLGADTTTLGAVEWASRKPNLLNVAVTRAQYRFYIMGDYELWRRYPYFEVAASKLERIHAPDEVGTHV